MFEINPTEWNDPTSYHDLYDRLAETVRRWQWTDALRYSLRPEFFRRNGVGRGRVLGDNPNSPPLEVTGCCLYGFTDDDDVMLERYYYTPDDSTETFYLREEGQTQGFSYRFSPEGEPFLESVSQWHYGDDGRITAYEVNEPERSNIGGLVFGEWEMSYREQYSYDENGKLLLVQVYQREGQHRIRSIEETFAYDSLGRLDLIYRQDSEEEDDYIIYQRPKKGQTLRWLRETIQARLLEHIPALAQDLLDSQERLYCLALNYNLDEEDPLPPTLSLGTYHARTSIFQEHGEEAADYLWDPDVFTQHGPPTVILADEVDDDALTDACFLLNQQMAFVDDLEMARELLNDVARELTGFNWKEQGVAVTPDFAAYALDFEWEDFEDNFAYSVPLALLESLQEEGLF